MREVVKRFRDIHEAIVRIEKYTQGGRISFDRDELVQIWVIHHLEIIGETASAIRRDHPDYPNFHPDIPWVQICGLRNVLVHRYFGIDPNIVWAVVEDALPPLKSSVEAILDERAPQ
jgi:uncharacterized protein with HEPN domain